MHQLSKICKSPFAKKQQILQYWVYIMFHSVVINVDFIIHDLLLLSYDMENMYVLICTINKYIIIIIIRSFYHYHSYYHYCHHYYCCCFIIIMLTLCWLLGCNLLEKQACECAMPWMVILTIVTNHHQHHHHRHHHHHHHHRRHHQAQSHILCNWTW